MGDVLKNNRGLRAQSETIGAALILLFLVKPTIDILWFLPFFSIGGKQINTLHLTGILVLLYFGRYLFVFRGMSPPYAWVFKLFIVINFISVFVTAYHEPVGFIPVVDLMLRMLDSLIIFSAAYYAALYCSRDYYYKLVKAISIGAFVALTFNFVAILMGYEGREVTSGTTHRISGLYYDPGVLANVAVYAIVFTVFMGNMLPDRNIMRKLHAGLVTMMALYVIYTGLSRAAIVLLGAFGVIYITLFKKGVLGRIVPPLILGGMLVLGAISGMDYVNYVDRFGSEIAVFSDSNERQTNTDKSVDLGKYEGLGSNRGQLIAYMLDDFIKRPTYQQLIGNFNITRAHSDYFDVLSRNGYIGLAVYVGMLLLIWKKALGYTLRRKDQTQEWKISVLGFTLISMYILYAFPHRPLYYTTIAWFMWAILGCMFAAAQRKGDKDNGEQVDTGEPVKVMRIIPKKSSRIIGSQQG